MRQIPDFALPLFVPATRPERFEKAAASGADAVILDLEDAVGRNEKDAARSGLRLGFTELPVIIRINGCGTPWHAADLEQTLALAPDAIMIPKAGFDAQHRELFDRLAEKLPLIAIVETAAGLATCRAIAAHPAVQRLAFGSWDFAADLGFEHTPRALLAARSEIVLASRLGGLAGPIDGVTASIDDATAIETDAREALELGFAGKMLIHPRQVQPARAGLAPPASAIDWARRVLGGGDGARAIDGAMVDEPVRLRAQGILARAAALNPPPKESAT